MRAPIRFTVSRDFLPIHSFPHDARGFGSKRFLEAAKVYYREEFGEGTVEVEMVRDGLAVTWTQENVDLDPVDFAVELLKRKQHVLAVPILLGLLAEVPTDPKVLYNLGMAESDLGKLDDAVSHLAAAVAAEPANVNARVALGVAHGRAGRTDEAITALDDAVTVAPDNPWARRNLGAMLGKAGRAAESEPHLREAARLLPDDQQALYGLAHILVVLGGDECLHEADGLFRRAIAIDPDSELAEVCRKELSQIAQGRFRSAVDGQLRMDAVMYCAGAMKTFREMPMEQVKKVTFEIAVLGMQGLDVNDSTQKYHLRSLPGQFSGLHLVSILYVGTKLLDPTTDTGFDLSREYEAALGLA